MKRFIAGLLVLCSLFLLIPGVLAAEPESPDSEPTDSVVQPEGETTPQPLPEEQPQREPEAPPQPEQPEGNNLDALRSETAIQRMEVRVYVDEDGFVTVNELIEMQIIGSVEEIRFSFPEGAKKCDIGGYWTKSDNDNGLKYLTVKNRKGFTGSQTFNLSYTLNGLVSGGEASQIFNLPLLSLQDYKIGYFIFQVTMPATFTKEPYFSSGYYGDLVDELMTIQVKDNVITGVVNQIIRDNDSLLLTHVLPEGYFKGSYGESRLSPVMTAIVMVVLIFTLLYWFRTMRNGSLHVQSRTLPPDGVNPGDIPYLLAGGQADFNMLVTHWAILGYLSFYIDRGGDIILQRRMEMGNERRPFERKLFDLLFGESDVCDGASLRYKKVGEKAMRIIPHYWQKRLYDKRSGSVKLVRLLCGIGCAVATLLAMDAVAPAKAHFLYLLLGLVAGGGMSVVIVRAFGAYYLNNWVLTAAGGVCALLLLIVGGLGGATYVMLPAVAITAFIGWQTTHGGRRRAYGDEVIAQALGFRRFLKSANENSVLQMQRRDPQYFYKILPFAEAMGMSQKFVPLFSKVKLEPCQWYESAREVPTSALSFYERYADMLDLLNISLKK